MAYLDQLQSPEIFADWLLASLEKYAKGNGIDAFEEAADIIVGSANNQSSIKLDEGFVRLMEHLDTTDQPVFKSGIRHAMQKLNGKLDKSSPSQTFAVAFLSAVDREIQRPTPTTKSKASFVFC